MNTQRPRRTTPRPTAIITLLTDFGTQDAFVGTMKGVILARCPAVQLVDLTHAVEPADIQGGALMLGAAAPYFPAGTVHLAVVDPGVGGTRRPLALTAGGQYFVGPDNGLLWPAASAAGEPIAYELRESRFRLPKVSATFHGRDIFAPAAALLASGETLSALGQVCGDPCTLAFPKAVTEGDRLTGDVIWIDRFGNAITNLTPEAAEKVVGVPFRLRVNGIALEGPATHYGAVRVGQPVLLLGSMGYYEIAINQGNAAATLGITRGAVVEVEAVANGGF